MRAGPKGIIQAEPLDLFGWPSGRAKRREKFIGEYLITPRGHGAGEPFKLRPFQREAMRYGIGRFSKPRRAGSHGA